VRVTEVALKLYYLWINLVDVDGSQLEEPIPDWDFGDSQPGEQYVLEIGKWLFERR